MDNERRIELISYGVGKGWVPLALELNEKLNEIDPNYRLQQIKEKFGGLRYYTDFPYDGGENPGYKLIEEAESKSYKICEGCGNPGAPREGGWVKTLCDECAGDRAVLDWA